MTEKVERRGRGVDVGMKRGLGDWIGDWKGEWIREQGDVLYYGYNRWLYAGHETDSEG